MLTQAELKRQLHYDPDTGIFTRIKNAGNNKIKAGQVAGCLMGGYCSIRINYDRYMAHRLAWLYMIGNWPSDKIDHVNRVRDDNRWCNLRSCNSHENGRNVRVSANNKTGFKGVHYSMKAKKFKSSIRTDVGRLYLGYFATAEQAFEAYKSASKLYHGDFYCEQ